jgi:hypothetical protein
MVSLVFQVLQNDGCAERKNPIARVG